MIRVTLAAIHRDTQFLIKETKCLVAHFANVFIICVERERKEKKLISHSCNFYLQLRDIYIDLY